MMKIKKGFTLILTLSISILFLSNSAISEECLRVPIGDYTRPSKILPNAHGLDNPAYAKIEEIVKNKAKDRVVLTIEGNAGSGKNFIADLIREKGIHNFDTKEIAVIDLDTYLPEVFDDGMDRMLKDSNGKFFIPLGDWTAYIAYMDYNRFRKDFESLSNTHRMIIVVGLYIPKFIEGVESFCPDIRIGLKANDEIARIRVLRRDGYIDKYIDSLDVIEKMKSLGQGIPIDSVVDNTVIFSKEAKLTSSRPSRSSFIESSVYGELIKESAFRVTSESEFELLSDIVISEAKLAKLNYQIDTKSPELSDVEAVVAGTFTIIRYIFNTGERRADVTLKRYEQGIEVIVESEAQQIPKPEDVSSSFLRPAFSHVPEVVIVNNLNGYSRTFGSRWSDDWIPKTGTFFALAYPQQIPSINIGWRTWIQTDSVKEIRKNNSVDISL